MSKPTTPMSEPTPTTTYKAEFEFNSAHNRFPLTPEADIKTMLSDIGESLDYAQSINIIKDVTVVEMEIVPKEEIESLRRLRAEVGDLWEEPAKATES